jgi:hypothetical protein
MKTTRCLSLIVTVGLSATSTLAVGPADSHLPDATRSVLERTPGLRSHVEAGRVTALYGVPSAAADTAAQSAATWLATSADAWAVPGLDIRPRGNPMDDATGRFTFFSYDQYLDGLRVDGTAARILVMNGAQHHVVYAGSKLVDRPAQGFAVDRITSDEALTSVRGDARYAALTEWTTPEKVVFANSDAVAARAWHFYGATSNRSGFEAHSFFVDASSGVLLHVRDEVYNAEITGMVSGFATPGLVPDSASNPPVSVALPEMRILVDGEPRGFTDRDGRFSFESDPTGEVTVGADLVGRWVRVFSAAGAELSLSTISDVPTVSLDMVFNDNPGQLKTAQVNAALQVTRTHNFLKDRQPEFPGIDIPIHANVNIDDVCNAFFTPFGLSVNFFRSGFGCANSAFTTIVAHEYGHFAVNSLGLGQGAFGEGYGDSLAILQHDDPVMGRNFRGPGTSIRNIQAANRQYPCSGAAHSCGQVVAGVWWDIKREIQATTGVEEGLEYTRQLFADWSLVTIGGIGSNSAHPQTAIEVLSVDDDDGTICNGTPHFDEICSAFASHGIPCPTLSALSFAYPEGRPELVTPNQTSDLVVEISNLESAPVPGTGKLHYRFGNFGVYAELPMDDLGENRYRAELPRGFCGQRLEYFFSAEISTGESITDPCGAPDSRYSVLSAGAVVSEFDFESADGWSVSGDAVEGMWEVGPPLGDGVAGDPTRDFDGSGQCFLTGNTGVAGDVDEGTTILQSPAFSLDGLDSPFLTYARWFSNSTGIGQQLDTLRVEISNDDGTTWSPLETVGPTGAVVHGGWFTKVVGLDGVVEPTNTLRVRFITADLGADSTIEAAVDGFAVYSCRASAAGQGPVIVHEDGETQPYSGYIDPRSESSDGVQLDRGIDTIYLKFNEPVKDHGTLEGGGLTADSFIVATTGAASAPTVVSVDDSQNPLIVLTLSGPITPGQWTTIKADVDDLFGNRINDFGNQGPDVDEPDRIDIGFLPGDVDQNMVVQPLDLMRFRAIVTGVFDVEEGDNVDFADIDRNGVIEPLDLFFYRQLIRGGGNATQAWAGESISQQP